MSKQQVDSIDATPSKRIYRSIIADYGLNTAICELVDNAIDAGEACETKTPITAEIQIDTDQQTILLTDNAGGVKQQELRKLVSPGESSLMGEDHSIGIFGVGSKRAVVALAQMVAITSRFGNAETLRVEYDDEWLKSTSWLLPYYKVEDIAPGTTQVKLSNLRFRVDPPDVDALREHLSVTYPNYIADSRLSLLLNGEPIIGRLFDQWAYPPEYGPQSFVKWLTPPAKGKNVRFEITGGLTLEGGSIGGDWGVFIYCNKRLVCRALRSSEVGFASGQAGVPHPRMSLARVIVQFDGPSNQMPWTSNKAGVNYNHRIFKAAQKDIIQMVKTFTTISKRLQAKFQDEVLPFTTGEIKRQKLEENVPIKPSYLPKIPAISVNYQDSVIDLNRKLASDKPWTRGLYEGIIAYNVLAKQKRLEQKNRILLIILDSTFEIACKEYLANEIPQPLGDDKLVQLFKKRIDVHNEVAKHIFPGDPFWKRIAYFYRLRCELVHKRANVSISDENITDFRNTVVRFLHKAFKLRFPHVSEE